MGLRSHPIIFLFNITRLPQHKSRSWPKYKGFHSLVSVSIILEPLKDSGLTNTETNYESFISLPQVHPPCKLPSAIQSRNSSRTKYRHHFNPLITLPLTILFLWHNAPQPQYLDNSPELLRRPQGPVQSRQHPPPQHLRASQSARCAIPIGKIPRSQERSKTPQT